MHPRTALALAFALAGLSAPAAAADRPNIVWIVSEDNSADYLRLFDPDGAETPQIAALAAEGILFTRAFSNAPVCSVARSTLATSRHAPRLGLHYHRRLAPATLPEGYRPFSAHLRAAGYYATNNAKEDYNFAKYPEAWDDSSRAASWRNRPDPAQPFFHFETHTDSHEGSLHFDEALVATEQTRHDPAAVVLPPYFPDTPLFRHTKARYLDRIARIDEIVGETVAKLAEDGLLEDTFVFYFGDHGGVLPRSKGTIHETGLHVPLVVRIPEKWRTLAPLPPGSTTGGFVEFVDFGPTVLKLAGLPVPESMDGRPFLGPGVSADELAARDRALGYTDRFDEKYDFSRSLRVGDWKYVRHYHPYEPAALQNNYRYQMAAYREWRELFDVGKLGAEQRAFFEPRPAEALYDLASDPHETRNLAGEADLRDRLLAMRAELRERLKALPDLGFYPESVVVAEALDDPVAWGRSRSAEIAALVDTADLMLAPFPESEGALREAFASPDPAIRYWAATVAASYGAEATDLAPLGRRLLEDAAPYVRVRAVEFLGLAGLLDPRAPLVEIANASENTADQLLALQAATLFHRHAPLAHPFEASAFKPFAPGSEPARRLAWFSGEWLGNPKGAAKGEGKAKAK
jgi:arylsulfatase A-like enzyme